MDIASVLTEAVLGAVTEKVLDATYRKLKLVKGISKVDSSTAKYAVQQHLQLVHRWADDLSFRDLGRANRLQDSFVDLDLHLGHTRQRGDSGQPVLRVSSLIDHEAHAVVLGDPGAGKTTSLKRIAQVAIRREAIESGAKIPVLVRFREFGANSTISESVLVALGATTSFAPGLTNSERRALRLGLATTLLSRACSHLLLDELDELHPRSRDYVVDEIRHLAMQLSGTRIRLTCRNADYSLYVERMQELMIEPLTHAQIAQFATKWLGAKNGATFVAKVRATPYSGTEVRPLTLAHLCAIYERSKTIPEKPRTVYRKVVRLLLEEWDEQRSVKRYSRYADFDIDRKEEFLEAMSYFLSRTLKSSSFSESDLIEGYLQLHERFGLPKSQATRVIREVESHSGLVVQVSHQSYEFAHKSIQEYLAANFILKLPKVPGKELVDLPNEAALAVALSSDPAGYFSTVVDRVNADRYLEDARFAEPFFRRLLLERVDWIASDRLGSAVLSLISRAYYPHVERGVVTALP